MYILLRLYINFFQPVLKLVAKNWHGAIARKVYDNAQTPYQHLLECGVLAEEKKRKLANIYDDVNPVALQSQTKQAVQCLWMLAE